MEYPDKLPATHINKPFPIGDIADPAKNERAQMWLAQATNYTQEQAAELVSYGFASQPQDGSNESLTHWAGIDLCEEWDQNQGSLASTGFIISREFINATDYLPTISIDLFHEIAHMKQLNQPLEFARAAWRGMRYSHPHVFTQYKNLYKFGWKWNDLSTEHEGLRFQAGMLLPYMLSAASNLIEVSKLHSFNSMKVDSTDELERAQFRSLFTTTFNLKK